MFKKIALPLLLAIVCFSIYGAQKTYALTGGEWQSGRIIDDSVFFDGASLSPQSIQAFLNAKVPVCDTNGTQPYAGTTRAAYGASKGYPAPYTCLKDFRQDTPTRTADGLCNTYNGANRSAAEIIYEVGVSCGVSQRTLVTLLEKEQSLVTDDWPWSLQYRSATGYGCPDTAPCDAEYYGFFNQVYNAARQFKRYARDSTLFSYRAFRTNYIQFNPNGACGGSNVFIQNQATAGLYNYTPYQPNTAALANLYGAGDACSAYGNRNFWRLHYDWFGPTYAGEYAWRVVQTAGDSRLFLQVGNTKRWIPTGDLYHDWSLDQYPVNTISSEEFNSIPTIPELTRLGTNGIYNYVVEGGRKHYLPPGYTSLWGYQNTIAAPVSSLLRSLPENEPIGRFIKAPEVNNSFSYWVVDGGTRHLISANDLASWGYSISNVVGIEQSYLMYMPQGAPVSRHIKSGGTSYVVDQGSLIQMPDAITAQAWHIGTYSEVGSAAVAQLSIRGSAGFLVRATNAGEWYMLENGSRYYISLSELATNWNMSSGSMAFIAPDLLSQYPLAGNLTSFAKDPADQKVYVLDGQKHHVQNGTLLTTLTTSNNSILTITSERLAKIPTGAEYSKPFILMKDTPHVFLLDAGKRYHVSTGDLYNAYNAWGGTVALSSSLINLIPMNGIPLTSVFKDSGNNFYLVDGGQKKVISAGVIDAWSNASTPLFSAELTSLLATASGNVNSRYASYGNMKLMVDGGQKIAILPGLTSSYVGSSSAQVMSNNTLPGGSTLASYLARSTNDQKVWFINQASKTEVSFPMQVTLGYLTTPLQPVSISNSFLNGVPTAASTGASLLIRKQNSSGVKFINFGFALGFPDGDTLINTVGPSNPVLVVDDYTYDSFPLSGSITRIIKDDQGKLYLLQNGQKRWFTNWNAYKSYSNIPITYLYGTTMVLIPDGAAIN